MNHKISTICTVVIAVISMLNGDALVAFAQASERTPLTEHYVLGRIRILYAKEGAAAIPLDDSDNNGVPDRVEDVAKQLWAAHHLFCEVLEFPDPFKSERYKDLACIQVSLRERSEIGGVNGVAFESAQRARSIPEGKPTDRTLVLAIGSHVDPLKNVTPTHEIFHLIQYSTTYFKNGWYLEGMARWAEHATAREGLGDVKYSPRGPWPQKLEHLRQLPDLGSKSETVLWNPIASRTDRDGLLTNEMLGEELVNLRYSDGTPVLRDRSLVGAKVMRDILLELAKKDDIALKELRFESWTEENQRSPKNNPYIYAAIMDAFRQHDSSVGEYRTPPAPK